MNRLLTSNLARHRLARTIIQGIIGVIIANLDTIIAHVDILPMWARAIGIGQVVLTASGALILYFRLDSQSQLTIGCRNVTSAAVNQQATVTVLCVPTV